MSKNIPSVLFLFASATLIGVSFEDHELLKGALALMGVILFCTASLCVIIRDKNA